MTPRKPRYCQYYMAEVREAFLQKDASYESTLYREHFFQCYQAFLAFKPSMLPKIEEVNKRLVNLPPPRNPKFKTIIFDLDET